jgi:hypothetical protein
VKRARPEGPGLSPPTEELSEALPPGGSRTYVIYAQPDWVPEQAFQVFSVKDGIGSKVGYELQVTSDAGSKGVGDFRFAVPSKQQLADVGLIRTLPRHARAVKALPWAQHSLSEAEVLERALDSVGEGGGVKGTRFLVLVGQGEQVRKAYVKLQNPAG